MSALLARGAWILGPARRSRLPAIEPSSWLLRYSAFPAVVLPHHDLLSDPRDDAPDALPLLRSATPQSSTTLMTSNCPARFILFIVAT